MEIQHWIEELQKIENKTKPVIIKIYPDDIEVGYVYSIDEREDKLVICMKD